MKRDLMLQAENVPQYTIVGCQAGMSWEHKESLNRIRVSFMQAEDGASPKASGIASRTLYYFIAIFGIKLRKKEIIL